MIQNKTRPEYISWLLLQGGSGGGGGGTINGTIQATQVAYGTSTDTIGGENEFVYDDTNNLLTVEKVKAQVIIEIRNETGTTIESGAVVYVSGSHASGKPLVSLANASDSAKMPSAFVVANQLPTGNNGYGILTGQLNGLDGTLGNTVFDQTITTGDIGKTVYVSPTNAGRLTIVKPTGLTELIQNVGRILDFSGGNAKIAVNNIGRSNDIPNTVNAPLLVVNSSYTFPTTDGTNGQTLVTNGAGTLSFQNATSSQIAVSYVLDETVSVGNLLRFVTTADTGLTQGRVIKANATTFGNALAIGVALASGVQGNTISVAIQGQAQMLFGSAPATTDNGKRVYLDTTSGLATLTAPTGPTDASLLIGYLYGANGITTTPQCQIKILDPIA